MLLLEWQSKGHHNKTSDAANGPINLIAGCSACWAAAWLLPY